jgi:uncharacterized membrane protein YcaP (DUF421 family)
MQQMFYNGAEGLVRTLIVGVLAYVVLIVILRISGKRTLSKMNAFDFVVTVALGSTLATILLSKDVALAEGALALGLLVALQYVVAWLSVRSDRISRLIKSEPAMVLYRGEFLRESMRRERVNAAEVHQAVRAEGLAGLGEVEAVVLETDGSFSVIRHGEAAAPSTLAGVAREPRER